MPVIPSPLRWALRKTGIDRPIGYALLGNSVAILARPLNLLMMVAFLTVDEQGLQYTFASVLGLKVFFELGLGLVVLQFVSHEAGKLHWTEANTLDGDPAAKARLQSLVRFTVVVFGAIALLFCTSVVAAGWMFFDQSQDIATIAWQLPWIWTVIVTAVSFPLGGLLNVVHGCGRITEIARLNLIATSVQTLANWGFLAAGFGLSAAPAGVTLGVGVQLWGILSGHYALLADLWPRPRSEERVSWWRELWPFQWRIAVSWLSSYLIAQLFTPLAFAFYGPALAAQFGLSLGVASLLQSIGWLWVGTKLPALTALAVQQRNSELDHTFFMLLRQSTAVVVLGAIGAVAGTAILYEGGWAVSARLVPPGWMAIAVLTGLCWHLIECLAGYLYCRREAPFLIVKVACALLIAPAAYAACRYTGAYSMLAAYLAVSAVVGLGLGTWIFQARRREWNSADASAPGEAVVTDHLAASIQPDT
jgi:hypothetical protein